MTTLAIDPGDTTGIAIIGNSGEYLKLWQASHAEYIRFLAGEDGFGHRQLLRSVDLVVVENFQLLPGKARAVSQKASRNVTASRGIGAAELWTAERGIELIYRDPSHWRIGLQLAGIPQSKWPKTHKNGHAMCAYGAGFHALVELGLVQSRLGDIQ